MFIALFLLKAKSRVLLLAVCHSSVRWIGTSVNFRWSPFERVLSSSAPSLALPHPRRPAKDGSRSNWKRYSGILQLGSCSSNRAGFLHVPLGAGLHTRRTAVS